ncbi:MAG: hypothetical protein MJ063_06095, partial [Lachnospiraceae bacterium]|nr:hypothetical protein [Lachnospiraceae bacterium]
KSQISTIFDKKSSIPWNLVLHDGTYSCKVELTFSSHPFPFFAAREFPWLQEDRFMLQYRHDFKR